MIDNFILSQILIGFASVSDFFSFQTKKKETTLFLFVVSSLFISAHYFLLGAVAGGVVTLINASRHFVAIFSSRKSLMYFFMLAVVAMGIYSYRFVYDMLPIVASVMSTFSSFRATPRNLRIIMMVATSMFLIYNIFVWSPVGIIMELIFLASNIISYYRFFRETTLEISR